MLQITAEEINFILYQYLQESGFAHSAYTFSKESNIIENKYRHFHIPAGMLIVFLEKALTLIHIETHYSEGDEMVTCNEPFSLLNPHHGSTIMSVKKPPVQNQTNKLAEDLESYENPIETIVNKAKSKRNSTIAYNTNEMIDKEMEDESSYNKDFSMKNSIMYKAKGSLDLKNQSSSLLQSKQSSFLQNNGSKVKILESTSEKTLKVAWNPKNHNIAFGGDKESAYLWRISESIENSSCIKTLPHISTDPASNPIMHGKAAVSSIDWKADGNMFVTAATDGIGRLWSAKGELSSVMYNDSSMPLKSKENSGVNSNSTNDLTYIQVASPEDIDIVYDCKWNKDGTAIVSVSEKHNVVLWSTEGSLRHSFLGHNEPVTKLDWKNNNMFATGSQDGVIKLWDVQSSSAKKTYKAHDNSIKGLKWDYSGALLASGSEDCTIKIWNQNHDKPLGVFNENKEMIHDLKWTPTGLGTNHEDIEVRLASGSADGTINIWNVSEGKGVDTLQGHNGMVMCIDFDPTYKYLVSADDNGRVIIWSVKDGTIIKTFKNKSKKCIFDAQWSHDGQLLATGYSDVSIIDIRYM